MAIDRRTQTRRDYRRLIPSNVSLPVLRRFSRSGFLHIAEMNRRTNQYLDRPRCAATAVHVMRLWRQPAESPACPRFWRKSPRSSFLMNRLKASISAKVDIHRMIRDLAHEQGLTIILVSSEEEEMLEVADDVLVFVGGRCDGRVELAQNLTETQLRHEAWLPA